MMQHDHSIKKACTQSSGVQRREADIPGRVIVIFPMGLKDVHILLTERESKGRPGRGLHGLKGLKSWVQLKKEPGVDRDKARRTTGS